MNKYQIGINERVRIAWSEYYVHVLKCHSGINKSMCILDYGCGFFDIGKLLLDQAEQVDGFDIAAKRIELLQRIYKDNPNVRFFSNKEASSDKNYDLIILNSVIQYFESENELSDILIFLKNKILFEILNEFLMAFLSGNHYSFFKIDLEDLKRICGACGLSVRILQKNLTLYGSRYTCILSYGQK